MCVGGGGGGGSARAHLRVDHRIRKGLATGRIIEAPYALAE